MTGRIWENPFVRQAVQAGTGVALAIGVGTLISGERWYWAVIAAFIVGSGVGSRNEALIKALQRLLGTLFGIVVGILLASAVSSHTELALGLVLVCVFFAFYAFQVAYGVMMFCITLMLALLYGLVGQFEEHLLLLRLEETAAGAAVGLLVTMTVLPIHEVKAFRAAAREFLLALVNALQQGCEADAATAAKTGGELQAKMQAFRYSVGGMKRGWVPLVPLRYRRALRSATRCAYLARELLYSGKLDRTQAQTVRQRVDVILRQLETGEWARNAASAPDGATIQAETRDNEYFEALLAALDRFDLRLAEALDGTGPDQK